MGRWVKKEQRLRLQIGAGCVTQAPSCHRYPTQRKHIKQTNWLTNSPFHSTFQEGGGGGDQITVPPPTDRHTSEVKSTRYKKKGKNIGKTQKKTYLLKVNHAVVTGVELLHHRGSSAVHPVALPLGELRRRRVQRALDTGQRLSPLQK